jgi:integrase
VGGHLARRKARPQVNKIRVVDDPDKKAALKWLHRKRVAIEAGKELPQAERITLEILRDTHLKDMEVNNKRSLDDVRNSWVHLAAFFSGDRATDITTDRIRKYQLLRQKDGAANGTINRETAALRRGFKLMLQARRLATIPHFPQLKEAEPRKGFLPPGDFTRFHAALATDLQDFALVLYRSGWRISELRTLERCDVDLTRREIHLRPENSKTGEPRTLPLDAAMTEAITRALQTGTLESALVFQRRNGRPIGDIRKAWNRACEECGLRNPDPRHKYILRHDFRRSAARNQIHSGTPETVVMQATGHKTRSIFDRYHIVTNDDLRAAILRQEQYLSEEHPPKVVPIRERRSA